MDDRQVFLITAGGDEVYLGEAREIIRRNSRTVLTAVADIVADLAFGDSDSATFSIEIR